MIKLVFITSFSLIICSFLFNSCSSVSKDIQKKEIPVLQPLNGNLYRVEANCVIGSTMNNQSFNFNAEIKISGEDTVSMTLFGPFGITVGKLYSDSNHFKFFNILENTVYQGSPTQENIKKATKLSISIKDFLSLFQAKTPFPISEYSVLTEKDDLDKVLLKRVDKSNFGDFAVIGKSESKMIQYQRKDKGDILILNATFDKYKTIENSYMPQSINLTMPTVGGKLIIEVEDFKINSQAEMPVPFITPSTVKIIELK